MIMFFGFTGISAILLSIIYFALSKSAIHEILSVLILGIGFLNLGLSRIIAVLDEIYENTNKDEKK